MTKVYKHILVGAFALAATALISLMAVVPSAWAAGAYPEVKLTPVGDNVSVSVVDEARGYSDARALSLTLDIDIEKGTEGAIGIAFDFSQWVKDNTTIHEQRPNPWDGGNTLELYVAGSSELLESGSLDLGTVVISYDSAVSPRSVVVVSVPGTNATLAAGEASEGALRIVGGNYEEQVPQVYSQYPAAIALGGAKNDLSGGDDGNNGGGAGDGSGINGANGAGNGGGSQVTNDPLRLNSNLTGDLARTGDTLMPLVVTLLCIAALAAAAIGFILIRQRKRKQL